MANLTLTIPDDVLKRARLRALEQGTSVNAIVREQLAQYAGANAAHRQAVDTLLRLSRATQSRRGRRRWTRDELHDR
jgi:plasmid stability protein